MKKAGIRVNPFAVYEKARRVIASVDQDPVRSSAQMKVVDRYVELAINMLELSGSEFGWEAKHVLQDLLRTKKKELTLESPPQPVYTLPSGQGFVYPFGGLVGMGITQLSPYSILPQYPV